MRRMRDKGIEYGIVSASCMCILKAPERGTHDDDVEICCSVNCIKMNFNCNCVLFPLLVCEGA